MKRIRAISGDQLGYESDVIDRVRKQALVIEEEKDLNALVDQIGDSRIVLLGEASHGTHEFYLWRAAITKRLIQNKGFSFVSVEGDWPDCYRLNRYIKNYPEAGNSAYEVLQEFRRWPTWMWANWEIVAFAGWLHKYNRKNLGNKVGFYGLDVYSLGESLQAILDYLEKVDTEAWHTAMKAVACFEPYGFEGSDYARATRLVPDRCTNEVVDLLMEIRRKTPVYNTDHETVFSTEQNALVAVHAENYYRKMITGGPDSWNIRDRHMTETLERLMKFHGPEAKAVVWEHNTHIGDARATDMTAHGMVNVGELLTRSHQREGVVKVGFGTYRGRVIAGRNWGDVMRVMQVPEGVEGSWEYLLHHAGKGKDLLVNTRDLRDDKLFENPIGHRAIGVVYHPEYEHRGNYVPSNIPYRYDAFIHIDQTEALNPLHLEPEGQQMPETFPWGF